MALLLVSGSRSLPTAASTARFRLPTLGITMVLGVTFSRLPSSSIKLCIASCTLSSISTLNAPVKQFAWASFAPRVRLGWAVENRLTPSAEVVA